MDSDTFLSGFLDLFDEVVIMSPSVGAIIALLMAMVLLLCSGFASASEIAFFSLSPTDISAVEEGKHASDDRILALRADSERLLATILITNNFVNVGIIMLLNYFFAEVIDFGGSDLLEFLFMTVLIYSAQHTLSFCRMVAPVLQIVERIFWPVSSLLMRSKKIASKVVQKENRTLSVDELEQALELTDKKEIAEEQNMLEGIIRFGGEMAREVMTPRVDIVDLDIKTPYSEVLKCIVENNYSRIPVYSGSKDNIKGVLYIKDLLPHLNKPANFRWQSLMRPPFFVPETKMIDDLLRDFQTNKVHIAIVVDEFGGTSGIVTMEDIIEEIVGEINDEYDEEEMPYVKVSANSFVFEAKVLLSDFYKIMKLDDETFDDVAGEADTLAGLLLEIKGEFPKLHEVITYRNFRFEIVEMDERRIVKVQVTVEPEHAADAQEMSQS